MKDTANEEVTSFISQFSSARNLFMNRMCYWFSVILNIRFAGSEIWYNPIQNHFVCSIDGVFYDASGIAKRGNYMPWTSYSEQDELHTARIVRDTINKID